MEYGAFPAVANRNVLKKELLLAYFIKKDLNIIDAIQVKVEHRVHVVPFCPKSQ